MIRHEQLSRTISHALRHEPWLYEIELDDEGWTPVGVLLDALRRSRPELTDLDRSDLEAMIASAPKQRFELAGDRIRARYGHSLPGRLARTPTAPPEILFHGTSPKAWQAIAADGLRPMGRQYVHLSTDEGTAREVARRKARVPVILRVHAARAYRAGARFYAGNPSVWLADSVPAEDLEPIDVVQPASDALS